MQAPTDGLPVLATTKEANLVQDLVDEAKGATVQRFDEFATPEQKAAQAAKAKSALAPSEEVRATLSNTFKTEEAKQASAQGGAKGVATDIGGKSGKNIQTTISTADVVGAGSKVGNEKDVKKAVDDEDKDAIPETKLPGDLPEKQATKPREIPDWFKIGWSGQARNLFATPEEATQRSLLEDYVTDAYYGAWFHEAGIIIFAILSSHLVTLFRGGWGWLIVIAGICATYYKTSAKRMRRNARDDLAREVAKKALYTDTESADWMNHFLKRFWLIYEPVLSATIVASVDQVLSVSTPAFLDSIRMTTFTLGTKPPHIDHVQTFPGTPDDEVVMEWKISFTPNDLLDLTHKETAMKVNPKIVLTIRIGIGPAVVGKDIVVEDISFQGTMRIKLKLMNNFPHVKTVDMSFMGPPTIDFVLNPIGFDLNMIPGITPFINSQIHSNLGAMMYDPNVFTLNLEQMLSGAPIDTAIGVAQITIRHGAGLKGTKLGGGSPDPYVTLALGAKAEVSRTKTKLSTATPAWNETFYVLLNNLNEPLNLAVFDWNEHRSDSSLGTASFDLKTLLEDGQQEGLDLPVIYNGAPRGSIKLDVVYYPVLQEKKLPDGTIEPVPESSSGIARVMIHAAKELVAKDSQLNPFARLALNDKSIEVTPTLKRTPNPIWEKPVEFLVTNKEHAVVGISVEDANSFGGNDRVGFLKVKLTDLLLAADKSQDWFALTGAKSGRVRLTATWKPVLMAGSINGAGAYTPPIGVLKIWFKRAKDLKNVEALTGGKSDPYARIIKGGIIVGRTLIVNNDLDPEWDEIVYVQVHSPRDAFTIEVMDYQHTTKDRSLGTTQLKATEFLVEGTDKKLKPWESTGTKTRTAPLAQAKGSGTKGSVEFAATFFPCAHLKEVSFTAPEESKIVEVDEEDEAAAETATVSDAGTAGKAKKEEDPNAGIVIPRAELIQRQSGILAFQLVSGKLARKGARLEVLFDDGYWASYTTEPARSAHAVFDEIGEAFIRELDYSRIMFKLNMAEKETREEMIGEAVVDMNDFLEQALDKPATIELKSSDGSGSRSTITVAAKYIPVDIELEPRESVNNMGELQVTLVDGKDLPAADRSGKSDPYAVFELNDEKVHKSETVKKTLAPKWNEKFLVNIPSRVAANFTLTVYDWDRIGTATKLGYAKIDLAALEPFSSNHLQVALTDAKTGKQQGIVNLSLVFRPQFLNRQRTATSAFGAAGRVATGLGGGVISGVGAVGGGVIGAGGAVLGAGGKGVGAVGKGVFGTVKRVTGGGGHRSTASQSSLPATNGVAALPAGVPPVPPLPEGVAASPLVGAPASPQVNGYTNGASASAVPNGVGANGLLTVKVIELKGASEPDERKSIVVKRDSKTVESTAGEKGSPAAYNMSFTVRTTSNPLNLDFSAVHKKTIGSDKTFGAGSVSVWSVLAPLGSPPLTRSQVEVDLGAEGGILSVLLDWSPDSVGSRTPPDDARSTTGSVSPSTRRGSKFGNRFSMHKSREPSAEPDA